MNDLIDKSKTILSFLKEEMEISSDLLRRFSHDIGVEIAATSESANADLLHDHIFRLTEVLQCEDRIQQRLKDMIATLDVMHKTFNSIGNDGFDCLIECVRDQVLLEEMQYSLASKADLDGPLAVSRPNPAPSLGDVDLF